MIRAWTRKRHKRRREGARIKANGRFDEAAVWVFKLLDSSTTGFADGQINTAVILRCSPSWASLEGWQ